MTVNPNQTESSTPREVDDEADHDGSQANGQPAPTRASTNHITVGPSHASPNDTSQRDAGASAAAQAAQSAQAALNPELIPSSGNSSERVRIDKWLWAARFFKTRSIAANAISGGKVELNGERTKRSKPVKVGDILRIRKGMFEHEVVIHELSERRGPATKAQALYRETEASIAAREALSERLRLERASAPTPIFKGRPTKRDRRQLARFKHDGPPED